MDRESAKPVILLEIARESTKRRCDNNIFNRYKNETNKRNKQNEKFTTQTDLKLCEE